MSRPSKPLPTLGDDSELLDDPPDLEMGGALAGYRAGRRMRAVVFATIAGGLVGIAGLSYYVVQRGRRGVTPSYEVDTGRSVAERTLHWSTDGSARLGLMREPPGVMAIVLPDRVLRLADGFDHAQVKVVLQGGETISVRTLSGRIVMSERADGSDPSKAASVGP